MREVEATARQWRMGGAPPDTNHTRIVDLAWPAGATPTQEEILGAYPPSQEKDMDALGPGDFAQVPLLTAKRP
ncbi:MAG: glucodextranase DOMON-like domain-containing protein [Anaerolineae bacterium]